MWRAEHPDDPKDPFDLKTPTPVNPGPGPRRRLPWHAIIFAVVTLLIGLGAVGVSIWGMVEGIMNTDDQIPDFWDSTLAVRDRTKQISTLLTNVNTSMNAINPGITAMTAAIDEGNRVSSLGAYVSIRVLCFLYKCRCNEGALQAQTFNMYPPSPTHTVAELISKETNETISVNTLNDGLTALQGDISNVLRIVGSVIHLIDRQIVHVCGGVEQGA